MKTVTVRIPVAVDKDGKWVVGSINFGLPRIEMEESSLEFADMCSLENASIVWVTAEVPVPEPTEVEGRVE